MMQPFLEGWSERCNPILVKDVRSSLRGRTFKIMLWAVVFIALVVSFGFVMYAIATDGNLSGPAYFASVFGCLTLAVHGVLPFAALHSLGAEREEHTLELLQLSGLASVRLVIGKLSSVLLQALLVYSAFLPFLTFAFLMPGMPVEAILATLLASAAACVAQCTAGIAFGALPRTRWGRIVVSVVFLVGLLYTSPLIAAVFMAGTGLVPGIPFVGLLSFVIAVSTAAVCFATVAVVLLSHAEENRSTPIRVATTLVLVVACGFAAISDSIESATLYLVIAALLVTPSMFFVATERENLGRVVAASPPRWARALPPLRAWLPGGGHGAVYVVFHLAALVLAQAVIGRFVFGQASTFDGHFMRLFSTTLVLAVYLLLPSGLFTRFTARPGGVAWVRFSIVLFTIGTVLMPVLARVFLPDVGLSDWSLVARPFDFETAGHPGRWAPLILLYVLAILSVIVNVPRVLRARREWSEALQKQAAKEALSDAPQS